MAEDKANTVDMLDRTVAQMMEEDSIFSVVRAESLETVILVARGEGRKLLDQFIEVMAKRGLIERAEAQPLEELSMPE